MLAQAMRCNATLKVQCDQSSRLARRLTVSKVVRDALHSEPSRLYLMLSWIINCVRGNDVPVVSGNCVGSSHRRPESRSLCVWHHRQAGNRCVKG
uniref:Transposase n=1 Tax=Mesocestoides corti TaxID=53468 RepID=A0A5K3G6P7_MESCO